MDTREVLKIYSSEFKVNWEKYNEDTGNILLVINGTEYTVHSVSVKDFQAFQKGLTRNKGRALQTLKDNYRITKNSQAGPADVSDQEMHSILHDLGAYGSFSINWVKPNFMEEMEEIRNYGDHTGMDEDELNQFIQDLRENGKLISIPSFQWSNISNATHDATGDSHLVGHQGFSLEQLQEAMKKGERISAPIVVEEPEGLYLVSGNTRLTAAMLLSARATVWLVS